MAAIRVSGLHGASSEIVRYLNLHFKNKHIGGGCINSIYYPLLNKDAVIVFDEDDSVDLAKLTSVSSHTVNGRQIQISSLPKQVFSQLIAIVSDVDICQYLYDREEVLGNIYQKVGAHVNNNNGSFYITGNAFQIEWVWNYLADNMQGLCTDSQKTEISHTEPKRLSEASSCDETDIQLRTPHNQALNRVSSSSYDRSLSEGTSIGSLEESETTESAQAEMPEADIQQKPKVDVNTSNSSKSVSHANNDIVSVSASVDEEVSVDGKDVGKDVLAVGINVEKVGLEDGEESKTDSHIDEYPTSLLRDKRPAAFSFHDDIASTNVLQFSDMHFDSISPSANFQYHALSVIQNLDDVRFSLPSYNSSTETPPEVLDRHTVAELNTWDKEEHRLTRNGEKFDFIELESSFKRFDTVDPTDEQSARKLLLFIDVLDISEAQTDTLAIVSDQKLNMKTTIVGKLIAKKAGPQFHQDCKDLMKSRKQKPFANFEIIHTSAGGKLSDKIRFIIHTFLPIWLPNMANDLTEELINVYLKIFSLADNLEAGSITLPLLGTGNPSFPLEVSLASLKEGIGRFQNSQHNTCLNEIHIVNIHKKEVKKMRERLLKECVNGDEASSRNSAELFQPITFTMKPMKKIPQTPTIPNPETIRLSDSLLLRIYTANITSVDVYTLAMITDKDLNHIGNLSRLVSAKCGDTFKKECKKMVAKNGSLSFGDIVHVTAGNPTLMKKYIVMTCLEKWTNKEDEDKNKRALLFAYCNILIHVDSKLEMESLAMPLFGTGELGIEPTTSAATLFTALNMFSKYRKGPHRLREVHIVNIDDELTKVACSLLKYLSVSGDDDDVLRLGLDKFYSDSIDLFLPRKDC